MDIKITIHSLKFKASSRLDSFIVDKIERLVKNLPQLIDVDVVLKLEQDHEQGNKVVDIRLNVPNQDLFASKQAKTFEEACLEACDALRNQIEKTKKN
jgi:putative sigma-54 modulation protein